MAGGWTQHQLMSRCRPLHGHTVPRLSPSPPLPSHLGRGHHREGAHHAVRVFLADLADQQCAHTGASAAAQRVAELEACSLGRAMSRTERM